MLLTLDGVAAGDNGAIEGVDYGDEGSWGDIFATLRSVDAMLIGAGAHREYLSYWASVLTNPNAKPNERQFAEIAARIPHFILSRSALPVQWPNTSVLVGGVDAIAGLKEQSGGEILLWAGRPLFFSTARLPTYCAASGEAHKRSRLPIHSRPTFLLT